MRFLVVYSGVEKSAACLQWSAIIRQSIEECTEVCDTSNDYIEITDLRLLDKYLIDADRAGRAEDTKAFDLIDVVFVFGDHRRLPWMDSTKRVGPVY